MNKKIIIILTCEHASNHVPVKFRKYFPKDVLTTHRAYDIGAKRAAHYIQKKLNTKLFEVHISRLVIEVNRSLHHPKLFSEFMNLVSEKEKNELIKKYYLKHRLEVQKEIQRFIKKNYIVLHLGIHSFTPVLQQKVRKAEIGLLFDPSRERETRLCTKWNKTLKKLGVKSRKNYPYWGKTDGFTTYLRKHIRSKNYVGIEIEFNQKHITQQSPFYCDHLVQSLQSSLHILK